MKLEASIQSQYQSLVETCGFVECNDRTLVEVVGDDHVSFLQNMSTNDIAKLAGGEGCEAFVTTAQGKVVSHLMVFRGADGVVLETSAEQASTLIAHLDRYIIREAVELHDRSAEWGQLVLCGPATPTRLAELGLPAPSEMYAHESSEWEGKPVIVRRVPWSAHAWSVCGTAEALATLGQKLVSDGVARCERAALEVVRIEQGFPLFGSDVDETNLPQEVDRNEVSISFVKGCYLGQETVARIDALGHVNRTLCGLRFSPDASPQVGESLSRDGKEMGRVTSVTWSPRCKSPLALGYVRRGANEPGNQVESPQGTAEVIALPVETAS